MKRAADLHIHPFALMFPAADDHDRKALREDIRKHGVKVPVVLFEGQILDGRSRYLIARELRVPVPTVDFEGTAKNALELAASYNLVRRHLHPSQKAMIGVDIAQALQEMDGIPKRESVDTAAEMSGASRGYLDKAARIKERDPKLAQEIRDGETTIGEYYGRSQTTCPKCGHKW